MGRRSDHAPDELRRLALDAARDIVKKDGLRGLKTRAIAARIGYTVGTLYQMFKSVDHLIEEMNVETMNEMHAFVSKNNRDSSIDESLRYLVNQYLAFTQENPELWSAVMDHKLPPDFERSAAYFESVGALIMLIEDAISPLFQNGDSESRTQDANFLWASLFGITVLGSAERLARTESIQSLSNVLINTYLKSKQK